MQQIAAKITIAATAERFSLTDERGEQACTVTGKNEKTQMFGVAVGVKCRWDKDKLAPSNAALVKRVADLCVEYGRRPATVAEARKLLNLRAAA